MSELLKKRIGLYFGSFNPIHVGHLILAETICDNAKLDQVWIIVSPQNPFKSTQGLLHEFDRFDMVTAAVSSNSKLIASEVEFHLPKPSYTIDTLHHLKETHPTYEFFILMGEDNLTGFENWKSYEEILERYAIIVFPRPNSQKTIFHTHPKVHLVDAPDMDISSTYIRNRIKSNLSVRYLLSEAVIEMIEKNGYYR